MLRDGSHTHGVVFFILGRCDYGNDRVMYIVFRSAGVFWANGCIESGRGRGAKLFFFLFFILLLRGHRYCALLPG